MLKYYPILLESRVIHQGNLGPYQYELHDSCKAHGKIQYLYVLFIFVPNESTPILCVAAEHAIYPPGELIFGVFAEDGHYNHGLQPDITDVKVFFQRAVDNTRRFLVF